MSQHDRIFTEQQNHCFAWDGFSFPLPADWNLSEYRLDPKGSSARFEDDTSVRLEIEWVRCQRSVARDAFLRRYAAMTADLNKADARTEPITNLPDAWTGRLHAMPDRRLLLTAYAALPGASGLQIFFRTHYDAASRREPPRLIRQIAEGFRTHDETRRPWTVFDVSFELGQRWRLVETAFQAGRKHFMFVYKARRIAIWFCSLADLALRGQTPASWAVDFLKSVKIFESQRFSEKPDGFLLVQRRMQYPLGHFEEIARWCFKYRARVVHDTTKNRLILAVFQYRLERDSADADLRIHGMHDQDQSFFG